MSNDELVALATESVESFNRSDWPAVEALFAPGYVYDETGTGVHCDGAAEMIPYLQAWKAAVSDATCQITRMLIDGNTSVLEVVWRGTQTGPLHTSAGVIPPSGRPFEICGALWQEWSGGKLTSERHHLDVLALLAQIGALPAPQHA